MNTTTNNRTNPTPTEKVNTFDAIVKAYNEKQDAKTLTDLAVATVLAVEKKIIQVSDDPTVRRMRRSLLADLDLLERQATAVNTATALKLNRNGDYKTVTADGDMRRASLDLCGQNLGDGLDLVHDAIIAITDATSEQRQRDPDDPTDLLRPYTVNRLKKRVYIQTADSVNGWETVETTPMREIYKAVRRSIMASRAVQVASHKYAYLEDLAVDADGEQTDDRIYRRLTAYTDNGSITTDLYGRPDRNGLYTADATTVATTETIIDALKLTDRQALIFSYRLKGYGLKAIATAVGVHFTTVKGHLKAIQGKVAKLATDRPDLVSVATVEKIRKMTADETADKTPTPTPTADKTPTADPTDRLSFLDAILLELRPIWIKPKTEK